MKTKRIIIALFAIAALALAGCSSLPSRLSHLQGFNVGTVEISEVYPMWSIDFAAQGVKTDPATGITTINSVSEKRRDPFGGGGITMTGVELDPKKPAAGPAPAAK